MTEKHNEIHPKSVSDEALRRRSRYRGRTPAATEELRSVGHGDHIEVEVIKAEAPPPVPPIRGFILKPSVPKPLACEVRTKGGNEAKTQVPPDINPFVGMIIECRVKGADLGSLQDLQFVKVVSRPPLPSPLPESPHRIARLPEQIQPLDALTDIESGLGKVQKPILDQFRNFLRTLEGGEYSDEVKRDLAKRIQDILVRLHVCVLCPKTGLPGVLRATPAGRRGEVVFQIQVIENGKRTSHFSSTKFPVLSVTPEASIPTSPRPNK